VILTPRDISHKCHFTGSIDSGCHPDTMCSFHAAFFVWLALFFNVVYTFFMMFVLKYGSTSLLFLSTTLMVPVSNLAFALPIMPQTAALHLSDLLGLVAIVCGLILYRFMDDPKADESNVGDDAHPLASTVTTPWFQDMISQLRHGPMVVSDDRGESQEQRHEPLLDSRDQQEQLREPLLESGDV
jgi:hypothetical protein